MVPEPIMLGATLNTASIRNGCSGDKTTKIDAAMDDGVDTEGDGGDTGVGEEGEEGFKKPYHETTNQSF